MAGDATIGLVGWREQNLLQAQGPTVEFGFKRAPEAQLADGVDWMRAAPASRRLFVLDQGLDDCVLRDRAQVVGTANRRRWLLLDADAIAPPCLGRR